MKKPDLLSEFEYEGKVLVEWYDVFDKEEIPNFNWEHVYAIGDLDGKVPIIMYENKNDNLPGGRLEPGELLEDALVREIEEELNMKVISWAPLGYQILTRPWDNTPTYQFRVYAKLQKIGEFENDPGGSVIGHKLVELDKVNEYIKYGNVGDRLVSNVKRYFCP